MRWPAVPLLAMFVAAATAEAQGRAGDYIVRDFRFASGESLPTVNLHYITLGTPRKDAAGTVRNAVLLLHGTGGTGSQFFAPQFAGELFGPGQLLDTARYYVILPDNIGHGKSSKPSDGLRARFPHYGYRDMVELQHLLLTRGLGVTHLRLILGTSMGCMHAWIWGYTYPDAADGLVPLACAPTEIAGRNRMLRRMIIDDITTDPDWKNGEYSAQPRGLRAALQILYLMGSAPLVQHRLAPTRQAADSVIRAYVDSRFKVTDANDMLYQFDASRDYDPSSKLEMVTAPVLAINSEDDFVNPPELGLAERLVPRAKNARLVLIPTSDKTRGHGTHTWASVWGKYLAGFLAGLEDK